MSLPFNKSAPSASAYIKPKSKNSTQCAMHKLHRQTETQIVAQNRPKCIKNTCHLHIKRRLLIASNLSGHGNCIYATVILIHTHTHTQTAGWNRQKKNIIQILTCTSQADCNFALTLVVACVVCAVFVHRDTRWVVLEHTAYACMICNPYPQTLSYDPQKRNIIGKRAIVGPLQFDKRHRSFGRWLV